MKKILLSISCFVVTLLSFGQAALVEKLPVRAMNW